MPHRSWLGSRVRVGKDFVEADLDAAFALLFQAELQGMSEDRGNALRAIEEAEKAIGDGERRLSELADSDRDRFQGQLGRMRNVVQGIRSNLETGNGAV